MKKILFTMFLVSVATWSFAQTQNEKKMKILVHVTHGPEDSTRGALAFLVAKSAIDEGHTVVLFLAGDGVALFPREVLDTVEGLGTGRLRDHYDAIVKGGGKFYLSGMSSKARGIGEDVLKDRPAAFAAPNVLVQLTAECDRVLVY
jgi:predicted peroxiredoxin